jgi:hypothetical protein
MPRLPLNWPLLRGPHLSAWPWYHFCVYLPVCAFGSWLHLSDINACRQIQALQNHIQRLEQGSGNMNWGAVEPASPASTAPTQVAPAAEDAAPAPSDAAPAPAEAAPVEEPKAESA